MPLLCVFRATLNNFFFFFVYATYLFVVHCLKFCILLGHVSLGSVVVVIASHTHTRYIMYIWRLCDVSAALLGWRMGCYCWRLLRIRVVRALVYHSAVMFSYRGNSNVCKRELRVCIVLLQPARTPYRVWFIAIMYRRRIVLVRL